MEKTLKKALILTEGSKDIGFGHITRTRALYEELQQRGYEALFVIQGDETIESVLRDAKYTIENWHEENVCKILLEKIAPNITIIDSYRATPNVYSLVALHSFLVSIDDTNSLFYPNGLVVQTALLENENSKETYAFYLRGVQYALLRKEFLHTAQKNIKEHIQIILITFGGGDIRKLTTPTLQLLQKKMPKVQKIVIVASGFDDEEQQLLDTMASRDNTIRLIRSASAQDMKNAMEASDIAISAAGQTLNEFASTGTPVIAVGVAENQKNHFRSFEKSKCVLSAGWVLDAEKELDTYKKKLSDRLTQIMDPRLRKNMTEAGKIYIDGKGAERIVNEIEKRI